TPRSDSQLPSLSTAEVMFPAMSSRCTLSPPTTTTTTATTTAMTSRSTITAPTARGMRCRCISATSGEATVATIPAATMGPPIVYVAPSSQATAARSSSAPTSSQAVRPKSRSQRGAANTVESSASCADSIDGASAAAGCVGGWIRCQNRRFTRPAGGLPPRAGRYSEGRSPPAAAAANGRAAAGGFSLRGRRNVQIHPEQVVRVVLRLQLCQPLVVRAVAGADEILLLLAEAREVEVQA